MTTRSPEIDPTKFYLLERLETTEQELQKARHWASGLEWIIRGGIGISVVIGTTLYGAHMTNFGLAISSIGVAIIGFASQSLDAARTLSKHRSGGLLNLAEGLVSAFLIAWGVYKVEMITSTNLREARFVSLCVMAFFVLITVSCHKHAGSFARISQTIRSHFRRYSTLFKIKIRSTRF